CHSGAGRHLVLEGAELAGASRQRGLQGSRHAADGRARRRRFDPHHPLANPRQRRPSEGRPRSTPHRRAKRGYPGGVRSMSVTKLRGMTWSHPRGYDPMVACAKLWKEKTGVEIEWDKRSLQDFESFPVEELARAYDLIVIDHPHVGQITSEGCLAPLDVE